jgi:cell division protein FtsW (lipid II flippase)
VILAKVMAMLQTVTEASSTASTTVPRVAYLPESHTDFIFSLRPETLSIIRTAAIVVVLLTLIYVLRRRRRMR